MPGRGGGMDGGRDGMPHAGRRICADLSKGWATTDERRRTPAAACVAGLQLGPPGRWWDDKKFAKSLGLNSDQQKRMDSVFGQNRDVLLSRQDALQHAEGRLEALTHTNKPSEAALFAEIDHITQARADLEKAYTHMLLQLRDEMTPDQIGKLEDYR